MRISDWSADVCSSDLVERVGRIGSQFTDALRFLPDGHFGLRDGTTARFPTMLALLTDARSGEPCGLHRTALRSYGRGKSDRAEHRREGNEGFRTCRYRWSAFYHNKRTLPLNIH